MPGLHLTSPSLPTPLHQRQPSVLIDEPAVYQHDTFFFYVLRPRVPVVINARFCVGILGIYSL